MLDVAKVPADLRWTYAFRNQKNQIDHVLVSRALRDKVDSAGVDRSGMADIEKLTGGAEKRMKGITGERNAASDHGAVWVKLNIAPPGG